MRTNSMAVLDDKKRLGSNDFVSFRVVEDRDNESQRLARKRQWRAGGALHRIGAGQGRTCRELAYAIKASLEKEYYYHATVILAVDRVSEKSRGRIYVYGSVEGSGAAGNSGRMKVTRSARQLFAPAASAISPTSEK